MRRQIDGIRRTLPQRGWRLVPEAFCELLRARIDTLPPARRHGKHLGQLGVEPPPCRPGDEETAARIGRVIQLTARIAPFRTRCLQQAIAARRMLTRRGVPATVHLGMPPGGGAAHAWVTTGERIVLGDAGIEQHVVIGSFT